MPQLLGPDGKPIKSSLLRQEKAGPTMTGVRSVWHEAVAPGLTPIGLAHAMRQADRGYARDFLTLAEEMEERDAHYRSVLSTRKLALAALPINVTPASEDDRDVEIAAAVRRLVDKPAFSLMLLDLQDALGKGFSVIEVLWDKGKVWSPERYKWRDPRFFEFDRLSGDELRLARDGSVEGDPLDPYCYITHVPKLKSGLPIRGGLARLLAWTFMLKSFTLRDWAAFLEVFGMPLRVGKYHSNSSHDERKVLLQAVRDLSTDAAAIIPEGMMIEFIEAKGGQGNAVFGAMAEYLDNQTSKGVLGQTMTTDDGSSLAQAEVHEDVRNDILRADAMQTSATLNRDLVEPFVAFNYGPQETYPLVELLVTEAEDVTALVDNVVKLVPMGLEVAMVEVREKIGLSEPKKGETLLVAPQGMAPPASTGDDDLHEDQARAQPVCPSCGTRHALAREGDHDDALDALVAAAGEEWEEAMEPMVAPLREAFATARSYDELLAMLDTITADMDAAPLAARLAAATMKARGLGDIGER